MNDRLSKLAKCAAASMRGEKIDPQWLYGESLALNEQSESFQTNALWHTLVDSARALIDIGEYALAGEIFEILLERARERRYPKLEFDALEGLGDAWFYLGDRERAIHYLEFGVELATRLNRQLMLERFKSAINHYRSGKPTFDQGPIKAPTQTNGLKRKRHAQASTLLKRERNR